jgi:hypothetical protein
MKSGRTLQEMAAEIERQNSVKKDFLADTPCLKLSHGLAQASGESEAKTEITLDMTSVVNGHTYVNRLNLNEIAHRQLGEHTKIPAKVYDRFRNDHPDLLTHTINTLLEREPAKRMVRTLDGTARAFLSERYRCIDNFEIASAVLPILSEMQLDFDNSSFQLTDSKMYIKVVNPRLEGEVAKGDVVQAGIMITNSEVGHGSVNVQPLIFRLVCLNGMITNIGERKYHVGRGNESGENFELYRSATLEASDKAFMMKVQDLVRTAVDETKFNTILEKMREATEVKITGRDIPKVVELASREYRLNQDENDGILRHLIEGGDLSMFGLSSAVTRASQDVESYDRATDLEALGWSVLNMPRKTWNFINSDVA